MTAFGAHLRREPAALAVREAAEPFSSIQDADVSSLLERAREARVVLLGEATHGTSEFYRMRAHVTRLLVEKLGFDAVCIEGDWPDASLVDAHVRRLKPPPLHGARPFARFPTWMWRNREMAAFVSWLRARNEALPASERVGFYGLDLYSMFASIDAVLAYLDRADPAGAARARDRFACLFPWEHELQRYGLLASSGGVEACEDEVVALLEDLHRRRLEHAARDAEGLFDAVMNARLVVDAERFYRAMFQGSVESWNLRDGHMLETLEAVLATLGPSSRAVVWAHNSHVGDARATEMGEYGEHDLGQLCRERFPGRALLVGFGTHRGTVACASDWDGPAHVKDVVPSREESYERVFHDAGVPAFLLHLDGGAGREVVEELMEERLERAIGVIYRPEQELKSHYFRAVLPRQFDSYLWFDETRAVTPLSEAGVLVGLRGSDEDLPETYPTGL